MNTVSPHLYATEPQPLGFGPSLEVRSFLLARPAGNLLVYQAATIADEATALDELGGVTRQYLGHEHEAGNGSDWVTERFGAPLYVHEDDAARARERSRIAETFATRHTLSDDFEAIPIPGHTPGSTAYLWDSGEARVLFTADSVYWLEGRWIGVLLDHGQRERFIESLELLRSLEFDAIAPWVAQSGDPALHHVSRAEATRLFDDVIARIRAGEDR